MTVKLRYLITTAEKQLSDTIFTYLNDNLCLEKKEFDEQSK